MRIERGWIRIKMDGLVENFRVIILLGERPPNGDLGRFKSKARNELRSEAVTSTHRASSRIHAADLILQAIPGFASAYTLSATSHESTVPGRCCGPQASHQVAVPLAHQYLRSSTPARSDADSISVHCLSSSADFC